MNSQQTCLSCRKSYAREALVTGVYQPHIRLANLLDVTALAPMLLGAISTIVCGVWSFIAAGKLLPLDFLILSLAVLLGGMKLLDYSFTRVPK